MKLRDVLLLSAAYKETIVVSPAIWIVREFTDNTTEWHDVNEELEPYMDRNVCSIGVRESDGSLFIILDDDESKD